MPSPPSRWPPLRSHRPLLIALALALLFVVGTAGVLAAPPPQSVCGPCNDGLVESAREHALPLNVTSSTAAARVHPNGSATWTVTSRLETDDSPDRDAYPPNATLRDLRALRTNETLRRAVVRGAVRDSREYLDPDRPDATVRSVTLTNGTLQFTFFEPDVASDRPGGVLLFDEYHTRGLGSGWYVDVNTLEIVGPKNTTAANGVRGAFGTDVAAVDGNRVVLDGDPADPPRTARDDIYVAFVPAGDAAGLRAAVGIAFATLPTVVDTFTSLHLPGLLVLLAGLGGIHVLRHRRERVSAGRRATLCWFALSLLGYLVLTLVLVPPLYPYPMFGVVVTGFLVGIALVVATISWFLYPMVERWITERGTAG